MPTFIKTGFWEKVAKGYKGWLNLDDLITSIASNGPTSLSFPTLQDEIQIFDNTTMYTFSNNSDIFSTELRFPNLTNVTSSFVVSGGNGYVYSSLVSIPNLTTVGGDFGIRGGSNTSISTFNLSSLSTVGGSINVEGVNTYPTLNLSALTTVGGSITIAYGNFIDTDSTIDLSSLVTVGGNIGFNANPSISTFNLNSLTTVNEINVQAGTSTNPATLNLSSLTTIRELNINNSGISTINLNSLTTVGYEINFYRVNLLTSLDLSSLTTFSTGSNGFNISECSGLTTVNISGLTTIPLTLYISFYGCALNVTTVNDILIKIAAISPTGTGAIELTGGTNAAPTGAGLTAKTTLQSNGWTVSTN